MFAAGFRLTANGLTACFLAEAQRARGNNCCLCSIAASEVCHELFAFDFIQAMSWCSLTSALSQVKKGEYRLCFSSPLVTRPLYL